jgi:hypothetical protein
MYGGRLCSQQNSQSRLSQRDSTFAVYRRIPRPARRRLENGGSSAGRRMLRFPAEDLANVIRNAVKDPYPGHGCFAPLRMTCLMRSV